MPFRGTGFDLFKQTLEQQYNEFKKTEKLNWEKKLMLQKHTVLSPSDVLAGFTLNCLGDPIWILFLALHGSVT